MEQLIYDLNNFSNIYLIAVSIIVQFIIYPSFKSYNESKFKNFHSSYTRKMFLIVGPIMTLELLCCIYLIYIDLTKILSLGLILLIIWFLTFFMIVPIHNKLNIKFESTKHKRLLRLNAFRTLAWIFKFLLFI